MLSSDPPPVEDAGQPAATPPGAPHSQAVQSPTPCGESSQLSDDDPGEPRIPCTSIGCDLDGLPSRASVRSTGSSACAAPALTVIITDIFDKWLLETEA